MHKVLQNMNEYLILNCIDKYATLYLYLTIIKMTEIITKKITTAERTNLAKNNSTVKAIREICEKYGYKCEYGYLSDYGKYGIEPRICIYQMERKSYYPDVRLNTGKICEHKKEDRQREINAAAYGSMNIREYEIFIYQLTQAKRMVEELNDIDIENLPIEPKKEEFID